MNQEFTETELPFVQRAEHYCAGDEQCISSVRTKLMTWGADRKAIEKILQYLVREDYINEQRYANAYCLAKMRNQKWGRIKLSYQLRSKLLPRNIVEDAIATINAEEYNEILHDLAAHKWQELKKDTTKGRSKLAYFLQSHGYDNEEILCTLREIVDGKTGEDPNNK